MTSIPGIFAAGDMRRADNLSWCGRLPREDRPPPGQSLSRLTSASMSSARAYIERIVTRPQILPVGEREANTNNSQFHFCPRIPQPLLFA